MSGLIQTDEALRWLREEDPQRLEELWQRADELRRDHVGDEVHLRGLVEWSNRCSRSCTYCGIRRENQELLRYCLDDESVLRCARYAKERGYGTVVIQAGEDPALTPERVERVVSVIVQETGLAITLSLGEQPLDALSRWKRAGADRYLLRFETSNQALYEAIHPPASHGRPRVEQIADLRELGYEVGSGVMVGIPGQSLEDLASDIAMFQSLDLDMIGIGPYVPHPHTPLGVAELQSPTMRPEVRVELTLKMVALTRIALPLANIPATTALSTLNPENGRRLGLMRGANVVMPNLTPRAAKSNYTIYPGKFGLDTEPEDLHKSVLALIESLGRRPGVGKGISRHWAKRHHQEGVFCS